MDEEQQPQSGLLGNSLLNGGGDQPAIDITQLAALLKALTGSTGTGERLFASDPLAKAQVMNQMSGQGQMTAPFHGQGIRYLYTGGSPFPPNQDMVDAYKSMSRLAATTNVIDALTNSSLMKRRQQPPMTGWQSTPAPAQGQSQGGIMALLASLLGRGW